MFEDLDFSKMSGMLEQMQQKVKEAEQASREREFTVKSGGGMVAIRINGAGEVLDVNIDESLFEDRESLQILLISAMNDAVKLANTEKQKSAMSSLGLGGLDLSNFGGFGDGGAK